MQLTETIEALDPKAFPLHRYKPVEKLGHGESGRAFLCFDEFMEQDVVVKTMAEIELHKLIEFQREATVLCRLHHKGLAQVLDFGCTAGGCAYIVSEYNPGLSLSQHISATGPLPVDLALKTMITIADALSQMHVHGVLHRDIKPSNILVHNLEATDSAIYLIDAGTGRVKMATMQPIVYDGREIPGDPNYMSPEQASRLHYDSRSEIFALGCTMFEILTGRLPFDGPEALMQLTRQNAPSLAQACEGITFPVRLDAFVSKCLARSPEKRYQSMPEVLQALKELAKLRLSAEPLDESAVTIRSGDPSSRVRPASVKQKTPAESARDRNSFYDEKNPVRLVNSEWMESSGDLAPEEIEDEEHESSSKNASSGSLRSAKRRALDSSSIAAPDESLAYFASSNIAFAKPEPKSKKRLITSASSTTSNSTPASPVVAASEVDEGPGLANAMRKIYRRIVSHHQNSEFSFVALGFWVVFTSCCLLFMSYVSYLTAPSVNVGGMVISYQPANGIENGALELASVDKLGQQKIDTIYIESPEQNLPDEDSGSAVAPTISTFETDLSNQTIWDEETLNLDGLSLPSTNKPLKSDIVIGQNWELECRKQWDGKLIAEKLKNGSIPYSQKNYEQIHLVISKMVQNIASGTPESGADPSWATEDFVWEIEVNPSPSKVPETELFPANRLKLKKYDPNECVMMMKPPPWMTNSKYLSITLGHFGNNWRVESIEDCSAEEWNHK